jgi:hypothetical protein
LRQVDGLKAALFAHTQNTAAVEDLKLRQSLGLNADLNLEGDYEPLAKKFASTMHKAGTYGQSVLKPQLKAYYSGKGKAAKATTGDGTDAAEETVAVSRMDYEKLVEDHANQERLLEAFQKENERLAKEAQRETAKHQLSSATYHDEREGLNKQLNHLKNAARASGANVSDAPVGRLNFEDMPLPTTTKTAEALRMELDSDATIRALKERLNEAELHMGQRERDLQVTIEKLRKDNRALAAEAVNAQMQYAHPQDHDYLQLQTENRVLAEELSAVKGRLEWFAQNQMLLDEAAEETTQLRQAIAALKRELMTRGVEGKAVDRLIHNARSGAYSNAAGGEGTPDKREDSSLTGAGAEGAMDKSTISGYGKRAASRNTADVKKIRWVSSLLLWCLMVTSYFRATTLSSVAIALCFLLGSYSRELFMYFSAENWRTR